MSENISPRVGDVITYDFYDDEEPVELGMIVEVLDVVDHWSKPLGRYPDHVFQVITSSGELKVWDFFDEPHTESELKVVLRKEP